MPQPKSPMDHLAGMPPLLMMQMEARIAKRLKEYRTPAHFVVCIGEEERGKMPFGVRPYTDEERHELARHILHRMMYKRMEAGKQFDSILESSRKYFAEAMLATAMEQK